MGVWLAVFQMAVIAAIVTYSATFLPYDNAMKLVYNTSWFAAIFAVLGLSLVAYLIRQRPRPGRLGPSLIHLGILTIVIGGFLTWTLAVWGTLSIKEGAKEGAFELDEMFLNARIGAEAALIPLSKHILDESQRQDMGANVTLSKAGIRILVERYVPDPEEIIPRTVKLDDGYGDPAIGLSVFDQNKSESITLLANEPDESKDTIAGLHFVFTFLSDPEEYSEVVSSFEADIASSSAVLPGPSRETIVVTTDAGDETIDLEPGEAKAGSFHTFADGKGLFRILQYIPDFVMGPDMKATTRSSEPNNPAVNLEIEYGNQTSKVWLFGRSPGFHAPSLPSGLAVEYRVESDTSDAVSFEAKVVRIIGSPGESFTILRGANLVTRAEVGDTIKMPYDGGFQISLDDFWGSATTRYEVIEGQPTGNVGSECVQVVVASGTGGDLQDLWIPIDREVVLSTPKGRLVLTLERPDVPLGFEVFLQKFEARKYPGSMMPSAYVSTAVVTDPTGDSFTCTIFPNNPLDYGGYKLYQSAYDEADDGTVISILGVSRDPGAPVFYIGSFLLVLGMLLRFYSKRKCTVVPDE
ncbi:MAG: cytochrome c biogenesis protein ResB [Candidatus Coatesbacteria bacterium]|nr:cytochrome c biogenesis protein ResB [Candidatus Coatesbacteria bacterium]